jgi:hypothetical protein
MGDGKFDEGLWRSGAVGVRRRDAERAGRPYGGDPRAAAGSGASREPGRRPDPGGVAAPGRGGSRTSPSTASTKTPPPKASRLRRPGSRVARGVAASWDDPSGPLDLDVDEALARWRRAVPAERLSLRVAEGFAHYAVYPEAYLEAARSMEWPRLPSDSRSTEHRRRAGGDGRRGVRNRTRDRRAAPSRRAVRAPSRSGRGL